ncbi:MAG: hypothetical protein COA82_09755 [Alkaliphilus sp.]|nr:MAG: hypothetical protein COA82_09755 [Alkaliphilus sp.]
MHENIEIKRLKYIQLRRSSFFGRLINYFYFTFAVGIRLREFRKYKAIIVYSNPPMLPIIAALAKKFFKTKVVFVSYDVYPEIARITNSASKNSIITRVMKIINKVVFKRITKVIALSNEMKEFLFNNRLTLSEK